MLRHPKSMPPSTMQERAVHGQSVMLNSQTWIILPDSSIELLI
jgi:hypothetical protein